MSCQAYVQIDYNLQIENVGGGNEVFVDGSNNPYEFRTIVGIDGVGAVTNGDVIEISNLHTYTNIGTGAGIVFAGSVGDEQQFRRITGGTNITVATVGDDVVVNSDHVFSSLSDGLVDEAAIYTGIAPNHTFRSIAPGDRIGFDTTANSITINNLTNNVNVGGGAESFVGYVGNDAQFRTFVDGTDTQAVQAGNTLTFNNLNTFTALSDGVAGEEDVFTGKVGQDHQFRSLTPLAGITFTPTANSIGISNARTYENVGTGIGTFDGLVGDAVQFRSILADTGVSVTLVGDDIVIGSNLGFSNVGGAAEVLVEPVVGAAVTYRTLVAGTFTSIVQAANTLTINNDLGFANVGTGIGTYDGLVGNIAQFRSILADTGVSVTLVGNDIVVGSSLAFSNVGGAAEVLVEPVVGAAVTYRTLVGGTFTSIVQAANTLTINSDLGFANVGTGIGTYDGTAGNIAQFRSVLAGTGITVNLVGDDIVVGVASTNTFENIGGAAEVLVEPVGANVQYRTLVGGTFTTITQAANTLTVNSDLTFTDISTAEPIFVAAGNNQTFKGVDAGTGIAVATNGGNTDVVVSRLPPNLMPEFNGATVRGIVNDSGVHALGDPAINPTGNITFGSVLFNVGGAFNVGTNRFVASVTGYYHISIMGAVEFNGEAGPNTYLDIFARDFATTNILFQTSAFVSPSMNDEVLCSTSTTLLLTAGQEIYLEYDLKLPSPIAGGSYSIGSASTVYTFRRLV